MLRSCTNSLRVGFLSPLFGLLIGCTPAGEDSAPRLSYAARLGEKIFKDATLSASGQLSCAGCHVASRAHASDVAVHTAANTPGVATGQSGLRNAPTLRYLNTNTAFFFDREGTPTGGFNHDGRAASLLEQARRPFLSANEMANPSPAAVVNKLRQSTYAAEFRALFGQDIFERGDAAFERALFALAAYQLEDDEFHPYSSRYDGFLDGRASLSAQELRGLALFNSPQKGNCAACHPSGIGRNGEPPLFTDFSYDNLGVPRNPGIAANADPAFFDLGVCDPLREDLGHRTDLCGAFKVPTLRNIVKTAPYFHNGRFDTLQEVVGFYVRRDTHPEQWYPLNPDGSVNKFNDLPASARANVNTTEAPYNRNPGDLPALDASEITDLIAFLHTLTDEDLLP